MNINTALQTLPAPPHKAEHLREHRIEILARPGDWKCYLLGKLGFSNLCIQRVTGLTDGQITYRLKNAGVNRMAYRNGDSLDAQRVIEWVKDRAARVAAADYRQLQQTVQHAITNQKTIDV